MLKSLLGGAEGRRPAALTIGLAVAASLSVTMAVVHAQRSPEPSPSATSVPPGFDVRRSAPQQSAMRTQWDYHQGWVCGKPTDGDQELRDRLRVALNAAGQQGWELVAFTPIPSVAPDRDCFITTFKRPRLLVGVRDWPAQ